MVRASLAGKFEFPTEKSNTLDLQFDLFFEDADGFREVAVGDRFRVKLGVEFRRCCLSLRMMALSFSQSAQMLSRSLKGLG